MEVILASASPRRQELLKLVVPTFVTSPADIDETIPVEIPINSSAEYLAVEKAKKIALLHPYSLVIGCDTVVIVNDEILGKPKDTADAERMLLLLSGRTHTVITGVCLCLNGIVHSFSEVTEVEFYPLSDAEISAYIATNEPFDKAGAYGIQGNGSILVHGIHGDFLNVVGLPIARLKREINQICPLT